MTQQDAPAQSSNSDVVLPQTFPFEAVLSKLVKGSEPVLPNAVCQFSIRWNFSTNEGVAELLTIDGDPVNIILHPLGIAGQLDFMSDMKPTRYVIQGREVIIYRVVLDITNGALPPTVGSAAIMFNEDGSCIEASENFNEQKAAALT